MYRKVQGFKGKRRQEESTTLHPKPQCTEGTRVQGDEEAGGKHQREERRVRGASGVVSTISTLAPLAPPPITCARITTPACMMAPCPPRPCCAPCCPPRPACAQAAWRRVSRRPRVRAGGGGSPSLPSIAAAATAGSSACGAPACPAAPRPCTYPTRVPPARPLALQLGVAVVVLLVFILQQAGRQLRGSDKQSKGVERQ